LGAKKAATRNLFAERLHIHARSAKTAYMKVSLNWLKDYLHIDISPKKVGEILTEIGLEVEGEEVVESIPGGLRGVVSGHVLTCGQHPNADRLSLTTVDVGAEEPLQIVCGAPNVAKGQKVLVATVGTDLYPTGSDKPLTIKKGKIRGETSAGMICAEDELGIGTEHDGILVLPEDTPVGKPGAEILSIDSDYVYEIGLTPNRSDATNHLGVARDLAAALKVNYEHDGRVEEPAVDSFEVHNQDDVVKVDVKNPEACPRYAGLTITDLTIEESPEWLRNRLNAIGVRPINNVVDATNFILHELGQPLHAFDLDKIGAKKIVVQTLPAGTKFTTLDEVERTLTGEDLMICDGSGKGMCIAGVFGGIGTGVTDSTKRIFLESAHFEAGFVRRTSMRHNLRTDAAKVFEKGSDPNIAVYALKRAALLIGELAGGKVSSSIVDIYPNPIHPVEISVSQEYINRLIGVQIPEAEIKQILAALDMPIREERGDTLTVAIPTNKADVTRPADVVEEILRIYGFNKVPIPPNIDTAINVAPQPEPAAVRNQLGDMLAAQGFYEMMAVSLSQSRYYQEVIGGLEDKELVYINNTSNVHLDIMRPDMLFSALEAVVHNQNRQVNRIKLFELGRTYRRDDKGDIDEREHLSLVVAGERHAPNWITGGTGRPSDFYTLKGYVHAILDRMGIQGYQVRTLEKDPQFSFGMTYHRGPKDIVTFGKVDAAVAKSMGCRHEVFYADFNWAALMQAIAKSRISYQEVSKFPSVRRDLALVIDTSVKFEDIVAIAKKTGKKLIKEIDLFDVYENEEQLGADKRSYAVSFLFEDLSKTLKDKEVDKVVQKLITEYEHKLDASIRR
jgi:phenylalanyl-tRNA synthetase beta chain